MTTTQTTPGDRPNQPPPSPTSTFIVVLTWLAVGLPLLWGVAQTISKALALFR